MDARSFALLDSTTADPCGVESSSRPGEIDGPGGVDLPNLPDRPGGGGAPGGPGRDPESSGMWQYRLESTAPPFWIPFVPVRIGDRGQMRLRRAQMQEWRLLDPRLIGAKGELLQRHQPMVVEEEEVPSGGATLERRWQVARWIDGSVHVWLQRTKRAGYGERSSGLRWDSLHEIDASAPGGQPEK